MFNRGKGNPKTNKTETSTLHTVRGYIKTIVPMYEGWWIFAKVMDVSFTFESQAGTQVTFTCRSGDAERVFNFIDRISMQTLVEITYDLDDTHTPEGTSYTLYVARSIEVYNPDKKRR